MRIVAFGTYQADSHPRVKVLIEGFRAAGYEVVEINEPLGLSTARRVSMLQQPWTAPVLLAILLMRWRTLITRARAELRRGRPDAVLVGYLGHFDVHLAKLLFRGSPIILDHLIFAAGTAIDRGRRNGALVRALDLVDRLALAAADVIVVDTQEHRDRVPAASVGRTVVATVGAEAAWFAAGARAVGEPAADEPVKVVFFGLFTPLQGAVVIGEALALLNTLGIDSSRLMVTMIGTGQDLVAAKAAAGTSAPVRWIDWVDPSELPAVVAAHHVALGIFGATDKGARVVPNKVYQSAAAGCAIVTYDTTPQRRMLGDCAEFVPVAGAEQLAGALAELAQDRELLARRRGQARALALASFTGASVIAPLTDKLLSVRHPRSAPGAPLTPRAALSWPLIKRAMRQTSPRTTLEIGCGDGAMGARLAGLTPCFTAVEPDVDAFQLAKARIQSRGGTVLNGTAADLPTNETFDLVCAFEVLERLEHDEATLADWAKLVRPGGHLVLSVAAGQCLFGTSDKASGHDRRYSPEELSVKLRSAGFEPVKVSLYGWPLALILEAGRSRTAQGCTATEDSAAGRTAHQGRGPQPAKLLADLLMKVCIFPFQVLQRLVPGKGSGIVALARRIG